MASREEILRAGLTKSDKIVEIGPGHIPLVAKREGWRAYSVDHTDKDGLINRYCQDPGVNTAMIEEVEHIPDLVSFLRSAEILCRPEGTMILAVPDKRVCFDFFRPLSTTGEVLVAHQERRSRHSIRTLWDYYAYVATKRGRLDWGRRDQAPTALMYSLSEATTLARNYESNEYIDAHGWVFVPTSFSLIMGELAHLGLTDWQIERCETAERTEFYSWLRRGALAKAEAVSSADLATERMRLLNEIMLELDDVGSQLPMSRASQLEQDLGRLAKTVSQLQQAEAEQNALLKDAEAKLAEAQKTIDVIRSSRTWRLRCLLRRLLRLPISPVDA